MVSVMELTVAARKLVEKKVPYRHQGRTLEGLDCIGMVLYLLNELKLLPHGFERQNYGRLPLAELLDKAARYCEEIDQPVDGCMVLITWPGDKMPSHCALYSAGNLIHCYASARRVVEHGYRKNWVRWTDSAWKLPGVTYE